MKSGFWICCVFTVFVFGIKADIQYEVNGLRGEVAALKATIRLLEERLNATSYVANTAAAVTYTPPVAFTAHLSTTIDPLLPHQHIAFDRVITNIGGYYSPTTGHFTAPKFGIYSFTLMVTNTPGHSASLSLIKNGQTLSVSLAHGTGQTANQWETSTISVSVELNTGDEVWVQNEAKFSAVETLDGYLYSSFTGVLVNAI